MNSRRFFFSSKIFRIISTATGMYLRSQARTRGRKLRPTSLNLTRRNRGFGNCETTYRGTCAG